MSEERLQILGMLKEGKVTVEEAEQLIKALSEEKPVATRPVGKQSSRRFVKVQVSSSGGDEVKINLPLALAEIALRWIPQTTREELEETGIDLDTLNTIISTLDEGTDGEIVNIQSSDGSEVRIFID